MTLLLTFLIATALVGGAVKLFAFVVALVISTAIVVGFLLALGRAFSLALMFLPPRGLKPLQPHQGPRPPWGKHAPRREAQP